MRIIPFAGLFLMLSAMATPALALESLRFKPLDHKVDVQIFSKKDIPSDVALIDLNKDTRDERIYKSANNKCTDDKGCTFVITAKQNQNWIEIGRFTGFNLLISDKTTYGIRNILVYNVPHNDYATLTYQWSPKKYRYEPRR